MVESTDPIDPEIPELEAPWGPIAALGNPAEDARARELIAVLQSWLRGQLATSATPDGLPIARDLDRESCDTAG